MPFAILPHTIFPILDISLPKLILGSKESDPSAWRVLADLAAGKTKNPKKKTLERILARTGGPGSFCLSEIIQTGPASLPWESAVTALSAGRKRADPTYEPADDVLYVEALRMERLVHAAKDEAEKANDLRMALDHISQWELCDLPSLQRVMNGIDASSLERFAATASPLAVVGTLYLVACGTVEYFGIETADPLRSITPVKRDGRLIRPMKRLLEAVKAHREFRTVRELSDFLLYPRSKNEDIETLRRVFRKWWSNGDIPPWSRVPHIIASIAEHDGREHLEEIRSTFYGVFVLIRLMDKLVSVSHEIHNRWLPDFDPLSPFQDVPLIRERAVARKMALPSQVGR